MRQHDAALLLRDMSRGVSFVPHVILFGKTSKQTRQTLHDMSCNGKAVSCHRTPNLFKERRRNVRAPLETKKAPLNMNNRPSIHWILLLATAIVTALVPASLWAQQAETPSPASASSQSATDSQAAKWQGMITATRDKKADQKTRATAFAQLMRENTDAMPPEWRGAMLLTRLEWYAENRCWNDILVIRDELLNRKRASKTERLEDARVLEQIGYYFSTPTFAEPESDRGNRSRASQEHFNDGSTDAATSVSIKERELNRFVGRTLGLSVAGIATFVMALEPPFTPDPRSLLFFSPYWGKDYDQYEEAERVYQYLADNFDPNYAPVLLVRHPLGIVQMKQTKLREIAEKMPHYKGTVASVGYNRSGYFYRAPLLEECKKLKALSCAKGEQAIKNYKVIEKADEKKLYSRPRYDFHDGKMLSAEEALARDVLRLKTVKASLPRCMATAVAMTEPDTALLELRVLRKKTEPNSKDRAYIEGLIREMSLQTDAEIPADEMGLPLVK
ncbi:TPA: hypothetical protein DDW35_05055 [Candidatus Sumerlaeota bacterium]|nr:hypothetical protein [Candidatus Sumerlaeota bacterium]